MSVAMIDATREGGLRGAMMRERRTSNAGSVRPPTSPLPTIAAVCDPWLQTVDCFHVFREGLPSSIRRRAAYPALTNAFSIGLY
jgi:hypothetical protein